MFVNTNECIFTTASFEFILIRYGLSFNYIHLCTFMRLSVSHNTSMLLNVQNIHSRIVENFGNCGIGYLTDPLA